MKPIHFADIAHHLVSAAKALLLAVHPKEKVDALLPQLGEAVKAKVDELLSGTSSDSASDPASTSPAQK